MAVSDWIGFGVGGAIPAPGIQWQVSVCEMGGVEHAGEVDVEDLELWGWSGERRRRRRR